MGLGRLFNRSKPKIKVETRKRDGYSGWIKCSHCEELIHANELQENLNCCPKCSYHYRLSTKSRLALLCDEDSFKECFSDVKAIDRLEFVDQESYKERLDKAKKKTQKEEAIVVGTALMKGKKIAIGVLDFSFMGGSMGAAVGERITRIIEKAVAESLPVILVSASGGARMQESIFSLMQMAKTSGALGKLAERKLPFISVLTNPVTGGVTASFASLGDIIIAEPRALIGFAGPRVVEKTIGKKLPPESQRSEFLLEKGMVDVIVERKDLKEKIVTFLEYFSTKEQVVKEEKWEWLPNRQKVTKHIEKFLSVVKNR